MAIIFNKNPGKPKTEKTESTRIDKETERLVVITPDGSWDYTTEGIKKLKEQPSKPSTKER